MFAVEYSIAPGNPVIGHLINILLYAATACLLLLVLLKLLKNYNQLLPFAINAFYLLPIRCIPKWLQILKVAMSCCAFSFAC
jgi:hypothetical protein